MGNFRIEAEFAWQQNDFDSIEFSGCGLGFKAPLSGDVSVASGMVNGSFDFPIGGNWKPFITGGIGMAKVEVKEVAPFVRTVSSVFKVESLPGVRLPVRPSAASRHTLRPGSFSLILNGAGTCCTSPNTA